MGLVSLGPPYEISESHPATGPKARPDPLDLVPAWGLAWQASSDGASRALFIIFSRLLETLYDRHWISKEKAPEDELAGATEAEAPAPEPWTPQRVFEWNRYYDLYVAGFVVLLAFLGTANKIPARTRGSGRCSRPADRSSRPGLRSSPTRRRSPAKGQRWVNIPWLYELSHYAIYEGAASLAPKPEPGASRPLGSRDLASNTGRAR